MLRSTLALLIALAATAAAHFPVGPDGGCVPSRVHDYVAAPPGAFSRPQLTSSPGCEDGHPSFGMGGAFLSADHHEERVCIADDVAIDATYFVAVDGDGDGILSGDSMAGDALAGPFELCATIPFEPGADGGWWVVLGPEAFSGHLMS